MDRPVRSCGTRTGSSRELPGRSVSWARPAGGPAHSSRSNRAADRVTDVTAQERAVTGNLLRPGGPALAGRHGRAEGDVSACRAGVIVFAAGIDLKGWRGDS